MESLKQARKRQGLSLTQVAAGAGLLVQAVARASGPGSTPACRPPWRSPAPSASRPAKSSRKEQPMDDTHRRRRTRAAPPAKLAALAACSSAPRARASGGSATTTSTAGSTARRSGRSACPRGVPERKTDIAEGRTAPKKPRRDVLLRDFLPTFLAGRVKRSLRAPSRTCYARAALWTAASASSRCGRSNPATSGVVRRRQEAGWPRRPSTANSPFSGGHSPSRSRTSWRTQTPSAKGA